MKKKKISIIGALATIIVLIAVSSCEEDGYDLSVEQRNSQNDQRLLSGEERAIEALDKFVNRVDDKATTRGAISGKVLKVEKKTTASYSGNLFTTRALDLSLPVYELTLLNDDNSSGFAVVAETPVESKVMAYAPTGAISDTVFNEGLADFFREFTNYTEIMMEKQQVKTRVDYEVFQKYDIYDFFDRDEYVRDAVQAEIDDNFSMYPYDDRLNHFERVGTFVNAMWDQGSPYNDMVPKFVNGTNQRVRVGCAPVAIGQLLSYYKEYRNYDWNLLTATPKISANTPAAKEVSRLLMDIALELNTDFKPGENLGSTLDINILPGLRLFGFTKAKRNSSRLPFQDLIYDDVKDNHPVLVSGYGNYANGREAAHIWIADRMDINEKWIYHIYKQKVYKRIYNAKHIHCNWGWGNRSDGWYYAFSPVYVDGEQLYFTSNIVVYTNLYN